MRYTREKRPDNPQYCVRFYYIHSVCSRFWCPLQLFSFFVFIGIPVQRGRKGWSLHTRSHNHWRPKSDGENTGTGTVRVGTDTSTNSTRRGRRHSRRFPCPCVAEPSPHLVRRQTRQFRHVFLLLCLLCAKFACYTASSTRALFCIAKNKKQEPQQRNLFAGIWILRVQLIPVTKHPHVVVTEFGFLRSFLWLFLWPTFAFFPSFSSLRLPRTRVTVGTAFH